MPGKKKAELELLEMTQEERLRQKTLGAALGCILPDGKAEQVAGELLSDFGTFAGVLDAPREELLRTRGVTEKTAHFLKLVTDMTRLCMEDKSRTLKRIFDTPSALEAFRPLFLGRKTEAVALLLLDGRGRLLYNRIVNEGAVSAVPIYVRRLLELCIRYNASCVMLAHNHPSGSAAPSRNDIVATRQVEMALESIDAELKDHLILTEQDFFSFQTSGLLENAQKTVRSYRLKRLETARQQEKALEQTEEE